MIQLICSVWEAVKPYIFLLKVVWIPKSQKCPNEYILTTVQTFGWAVYATASSHNVETCLRHHPSLQTDIKAYLLVIIKHSARVLNLTMN